MASTLVYRERRASARSGAVRARRRSGHLRATHLPPSAHLVPPHIDPERRRATGSSFDVAAALELNLDRFPTHSSMLTLLRSWLYAAEANDLQASRPDYAQALRDAIDVMEVSALPVEAIALLRALGSTSALPTA